MPEDFINGTEFKSIDVGVDYKSVLALATFSREAFVML
jgi:hypothetical protein